MFGSKIRSWMENHIGRPKKKGNKNKNGNSGNLAATNTPNGHTKKSSHQGDSSIGSPARRREVSPIQNHATSRVGWQSPQEVAMSPHSDHFGYRQMVKSSSSPRNMPRKATQSSTYSKSVDEKSLGKVPVPLNHFCKQLSNVPEIEGHSKRSTIAANLSFNSSSSPFATMSFSTSSASSGISTDPSLHRTLQPSELKSGKSIERFRGKCTDKENLRKNADIEVYSSGHYANPQEEESHYGKILPRKNDDILDRYDTANANVHLEACLRGPVKKNPTFGAILSAGGLKGTIVEVNRNILRMNQQQRCTSNGLMPPANHLAHVINSLSSPESAYSTGYSTDGTSPGASYTPEYYINMRTGTHYFPKGANGMLIESNRYKYGGLNKIDEGGANSSGCESVVGNHRRTESCHLDSRAPVVRCPGERSNQTNYLLRNSLPAAPILAGTSPIPMQKNLAVQSSLKCIESPSPRQRCRIRTNPWFSTATQLELPNGVHNSNFLSHRIDRDNSSTSSGVKSSASDAGTDEKSDKNKNPIDSSDTDSSSSTEIEVSRRTFSPNTIRKRRAELSRCDTNGLRSASTQNGAESDEDATLNEMMGKFDESYVYEKETDILSDSDPTDCCASDLDTGQDAGDECDTDELLEIDFIDTGSIQEITDKDQARNTGSCSYHSFQQDKRNTKMRRSQKHLEDATSKRRKRFVRRKKSSDRNHSHSSSLKSAPILAPRGCRSVGGTPVCLRRNQSEERKAREISPLSNRSNSLTFTEIHSVRSRFLTIAESEKALIKADLEADVKYKQLIHEAETILVSMKTNGLRETPTPSPSRRICNLPTNKRVEMLRNCEADLKRETVKTTSGRSHPDGVESQMENIVVNKRLEILRYETASAPNSPKSCRFSPRKTHITNFIQQNVSPTEILRRKNVPEPVKDTPEVKLPPKITAKQIFSPPRSPTPVRRRMRSSQMSRVSIDSDSDTDDNSTRREMNGNCEIIAKKPEKQSKSKILKDLDHFNRNVINGKEKPPLMSFRSVDIGNVDEIAYCPQSEPLKRKIYTGSASYDKIQKSLDMESEIPKKALLHKISLLRKERQGQKVPTEAIPEAKAKVIDPEEEKSGGSQKRQLILHTIEDLKRSLEDQSIELCGLNDPEEKALL